MPRDFKSRNAKPRNAKAADTRSQDTAPAAGLPARRRAADALALVLKGGATLEDALADLARRDPQGMPGRDAALARAIATTALRRLGTIRTAIAERAPRGVPEEGGVADHLIVAVAQILFLDMPDHAAVDSAVEIVKSNRRTAHMGGFVNALLRRIVAEREAVLADAEADLARDTPDWLFARWVDTYGAETARAIAAAHRREPTLDLSVKADPEAWAGRLDALVMPNGSLRLRGHEPVPALPDYAEGAWWVQDAAAALPARLLATKAGERVADLCAAPGGKTAQLALAGADVLAVDRSRPRLQRLDENMARLGLSVRTCVADALSLDEEPFDAILLDAPCSATGTIRRHPEVAWIKSKADIDRLADLQRRLLAKAVDLLKPGGRLVFCTCSLEPEEGEQQVQALLARDQRVARDPIRPDELPGLAEALTPLGDLRTRPDLWPNAEARLAGLDGFYAARLVRNRK